MTLWRRLRSFFGDKTHAALDRLEDPRDALEAAYREQLAALQEALRGVADVLTSEKRLELEAETLRAAAGRATAAATQAARAGDDESARRALRRESVALGQRERLLAEIADIGAQRRALEAFAERLRERVEQSRTEKLALGARFATAKAAARAGEHVLGLSDDMAAVARKVERARDASRAAQARAAALTELAAGGIDRSALDDSALIDARLAALKGETPLRLTSESEP